MMKNVEDRKRVAIYIMPNLLTTCSMFFGFYSIIRAIKGNFESAAFAILFATVFDILDGRVARMTKATSSFGEEYDSLSDAISFGVAPAVLMFMWSLYTMGRLGWLACFLFMACGVLRLARFNVQKSGVERFFFQGIPIPVAAAGLASSVLFFEELNVSIEKNYYILSLMVVLAGLMVSNLRYKNFKNIEQDKRKSFMTLVGAVVVLVVIAQNVKINLFIFVLAYVFIGILANVFKWKKYKQAIEEIKELERLEREEIEKEEGNYV